MFFHNEMFSGSDVLEVLRLRGIFNEKYFDFVEKKYIFYKYCLKLRVS